MTDEQRNDDLWDEYCQNLSEPKPFDEEADYGCKEDNYWFKRE